MVKETGLRSDAVIPPPSRGHTALPNALFDVWLPTLSDGELRVLLVVARSTVGWKEGGGRKQRDWLSHSQLCRRAGRSNTPISRAIDSLVKRGLLLVQNEAGQPQASAKERQAARSRLYFQLSTTLLASSRKTIGPKADGPTGPGASPGTGEILPARIHEEETTKETDTNFLKNELSFPQSRIEDPARGNQAAVVPEAAREETMQSLLEAFQRAYHTARPNQTVPPVNEADRARLGSYLDRGYGQALEVWMPAFFASSFGFVRRRHYSLGAYLDCFFVLQAGKPLPRDRLSNMDIHDERISKCS